MISNVIMWRSRIHKMGDVRQVDVLIQSGIVVNEISNKYGRGGILISSNVSLSTSGYELTAGPQGCSKGGGQVGQVGTMVFVKENLTGGQLRDTAVVLKFFDELFDSVNATILLPTKRKPLKCTASETSDHLQY
jgi:hypothetical protein